LAWHSHLQIPDGPKMARGRPRKICVVHIYLYNGRGVLHSDNLVSLYQLSSFHIGRNWVDQKISTIDWPKHNKIHLTQKNAIT